MNLKKYLTANLLVSLTHITITLYAVIGQFYDFIIHSKIIFWTWFYAYYLGIMILPIVTFLSVIEILNKKSNKIVSFLSLAINITAGILLFTILQ